jgi:hypothetical protein
MDENVANNATILRNMTTNMSYGWHSWSAPFREGFT